MFVPPTSFPVVLFVVFQHIDSDSAAKSSRSFVTESDRETSGSNLGVCTCACVCLFSRLYWLVRVVSTDHSCIVSDSADDVDNLSAHRRQRQSSMSMSKTLALVHLALVWSREALTLSDLLRWYISWNVCQNSERSWTIGLVCCRLVNKGHVPYVNAYEQLPDEMNIKGKDAVIFRVEVSSWA